MSTQLHSLRSIVYVLAFSLFFVPFFTYAQSQALSVTPPLFQLSIEPGGIWQSSVRVVNTNDFPLTVYAEVVNFAPEGEGGLGKFMPIIKSDESKSTLAEWIEISEGPYVIPEGETKEVSFFVEVPKDAAPGGHFAAILINTEPPKGEKGSLALATTQTVASLFLTRIEGDVIEKADIREFSVLARSIELPTAEFSLRFENKGNVHIQPRGNIVITNMWGKERGFIPINNESHFGNVLPLSIRDFRFTWKGEKSITDIGRYKAIATLGYGEDGVKSVSSTAYFWVIPVKGVLVTLLFVVASILAILWMIRLYIRRMLMLAGVNPDSEHGKSTKTETRASTVPSSERYAKITAPITRGTLDLRKQILDARESVGMLHAVMQFVLLYKKFFIALFVLVCVISGVIAYITEVSNTDTQYEVTIDEGDREKTITSGDINNGREINTP